MPRVVHFELAAKDPERAVRFYSEAFGWTVTKWEGPFDYWLVTTGPDDEPGIHGGLYTHDPEFPYSTVNVIGVEAIDEALDRIVAAGGEIVRPKHDLPGVGLLAYCRDPEGIVFGIIQPAEM